MKTKLLIAFTFCTLNLFSQINLVPNNGFETWTNSTTLDSWTTENYVSLNRANDYIEGFKSLSLAILDNTLAPKISIQVPMVAGTTYTVRFKYKHIYPSNQHPINLNISKNGSAITLSSTILATNSQWTVEETTFTPDKSLSYDFSISLFTFDNTASNVFIDDVQVYVKGTEQYTLIPDTNFERSLIDQGIDFGTIDGRVLTSSINNLTSLNVYSSSIRDLTGIENFVALATLNCITNQLTTLDLSKNVQLKSLNCSDNQLSTLDVSKNTALTVLDCNNNKLTTLDVSKNVSLVNLFCYANQLTTLDLSKNVSLVYLYCYANQLTVLDVSKNLTLRTLYCYGNQLTVLDVSINVSLESLICFNNLLSTLDVSKNVILNYLNCESNKLTTLDVSKNSYLATLYCNNNKLTSLNVSKNIALSHLECHFNQLTSLDVSKTSLNFLYCFSNKLQSLNLKNGQNNLLKNANIYLVGNPNLYCILVDDVTYSNANWSNRKDAIATFNNVECPLPLPSNNFTVESKGETCLGSNNGEINITATATYAYKASINGQSYTFTNNSLKLPNLTPGTYTVSISITGETFEQIFTVTIAKGATITGKSTRDSKKVAVEITEGTAPYTVFVDGIEQFKTTDSYFSVETKKGELLEVKTAKACEGIYTSAITNLDGAVFAYPNPTSGNFDIELPTSRKEVVITLYSLDGHLISSKTYTIENEKAQLSLVDQPSGTYVAKIQLDNTDYLKIIKN
ncbi:leucine-rich repeat domain-containing protein [Flavobacterium sp. WC2509]|uniref:leucine-rich repeat domain-containing protein n=1 Tax=Flavobacterium sp. WC2509 TaxID=3461406 RepID=UPI00404430A1